ncbi:MAG: type II toxin-antitoxin system RelE/ParE family toxin [Planctomycetota bacterium]
MRYGVIFMPKAERDLDSLSPEVARRILLKLHAMREDLGGDVKRLTNMTPASRLRVGDYRVLFEVEGDRIVVYRVRHRREAYEK